MDDWIGGRVGDGWIGGMGWRLEIGLTELNRNRDENNQLIEDINSTHPLPFDLFQNIIIRISSLTTASSPPPSPKKKGRRRRNDPHFPFPIF